tara:strand:- start:14314 stop:14733 length:420 start_codon:yes stop_codon:yes gene_type:complete
MFMPKKNRDITLNSTCASAMVSETVSARAAVNDADDKTDADGSEIDDSHLWGLSKEADEQMSKHKIIHTHPEKSEILRKARMDVKPAFVESLGRKSIGQFRPVIGRAIDEFESKQPSVSGACMFYMSDLYADKIMASKE